MQFYQSNICFRKKTVSLQTKDLPLTAAAANDLESTNLYTDLPRAYDSPCQNNPTTDTYTFDEIMDMEIEIVTTPQKEESFMSAGHPHHENAPIREVVPTASVVLENALVPEIAQAAAIGSENAPDPTGPQVQEQKLKRARSSIEQTARSKVQHPLLPPCKSSCRRKCSVKFSAERRLEIHTQFWSLGHYSRRLWMNSKIKNIKPKQRTTGEIGDFKKRNTTRIYYLPKDSNFTESSDEEFESSGSIQVCQQFFLATLGYTSNRVVEEALKYLKTRNSIAPTKDCRGHHEPKNKINRGPIKEHIETYHPQLSHYNREHAPNRRYISPDVTREAMYADFKLKHPDFTCSKEVYRQTIVDMNISFYESAPEKCSDCITFDLDTSAEGIALKESHIARVQISRNEYKKDAEESATTPFLSVFATDLQKVVLLPRFPDVKASFFCPRLVVFNETFANMAKKDELKQHYYVVWNEAIAGRCAEDVANTFLKVIELERDATKIIFWLDNCSGQNKNWFLFTALLCLVNMPNCSVESIELKYLVTGHTFMAADGLHGKIEQKMRKQKNTLDMADFVSVLEQSSKRAKVVLLQHSDFRLLDNKFRARRSLQNETMPLLKTICAVKFTKGEKVLSYKHNFTDDYMPLNSDAIKKRASLVLTHKKQQTNRGINEEKKKRIINELVSKMPLNRRMFWNELPVSASSVDLLGERGYVA